MLSRLTMLRSMTGFGAAATDTGEASVHVEVRSVNARHLGVRFSLPRGAEAWEPELRGRVGERVERGRVDVSVEVEIAGEAAGGLELDEDRVEATLKAFRRLRDEYALPGQVDLPLLVRAGGLLREARTSSAEAVEVDAVAGALDEALDELVEMREREGERLAEDLRRRVDSMREGLELVEELAPRRLERERRRLREAAAELAGEVEADDEAVAREIALLADKWDVGEETVRARSHLDAFDELLEAPGGEPVGKRLKFLVQELHREINTTGAKANDAEISRQVVEMKNDLESVREQVENVE